MPPHPAPNPCPACGYAMEQTGTCGQCGGIVHEPDGYGTLRVGRGFALFDLVHGFVGFFRGALLLFRPDFTGRLVLPMIANLVVFVALGAGLFFGFLELMAWWIDDPGAWADVLAAILALIALFLTAPIVIETVMSAFLDPLANALEEKMCGEDFRPVDIGIWRGILLGVRSSASILAVSLLLLVPTLLFSFLLPGIGLAVATVIAAALVAVTWFEIPFLRRGYGFRHRLRVLRHNWALALGFGLGFLVGMVIPVFNLFLLTPAAAAATTLLYFRMDKVPPR